MVQFFIDHDLRLPFAVLLVPGDAKKPATLVVGLRHALVLRIDRPAGLAQIGEAVVSLHAVDMVDF